MLHKLFYDPDTKCVYLQIEGSVTNARIRKIAPEVASLCKEANCNRLLNDMSSATIDVSFAELFESPQIMEESRIPPTLKRALVVPHSFKDFRFLETVSRNRGHNLRVFYDINEAKKWLLTW